MVPFWLMARSWNTRRHSLRQTRTKSSFFSKMAGVVKDKPKRNLSTVYLDKNIASDA